MRKGFLLLLTLVAVLLSSCATSIPVSTDSTTNVQDTAISTGDTDFAPCIEHVDGTTVVLCESDCEHDGKCEVYCSRCHTLIRTDLVPAEGHHYGACQNGCDLSYRDCHDNHQGSSHHGEEHEHKYGHKSHSYQCSTCGKTTDIAFN